MMKKMISLFYLVSGILPALVSSMPEPSACKRENYPDLYELQRKRAEGQCRGAINCEVYFSNVTRLYEVRHRTGMEPWSAWYQKYVAPFDTERDNDSGAFTTRSVDGVEFDEDVLKGRAASAPTIFYHMQREPSQTQWGNVRPDHAMGTVFGKCGDYDCGTSGRTYTWPNVPYIIHGDGTEQCPDKQVHGHLVVTANGAFTPKKSGQGTTKGYFIEAIEKIANVKRRDTLNKKYVCCTSLPPCGPQTCDKGTQDLNIVAGKHFLIQRFVKAAQGQYAMAGMAKASATLTENEDAVCEEILNDLYKLASAQDPTGISSIGEGYFGQYVKTACSG